MTTTPTPRYTAEQFADEAQHIRDLVTPRDDFVTAAGCERRAAMLEQAARDAETLAAIRALVDADVEVLAPSPVRTKGAVSGMNFTRQEIRDVLNEGSR